MSSHNQSGKIVEYRDWKNTLTTHTHFISAIRCADAGLEFMVSKCDLDTVISGGQEYGNKMKQEEVECFMGREAPTAM